MKKYLFTGFVTLLPLALTLIIVHWLFNLFTNPLAGLMQALLVDHKESLHLSPELSTSLVLFLSKLLAFCLLLLFIFILGVFGQKFLIRFLFKVPELLFARIPLVRTIFRISHDLTKAVFSENKKTFKETLLVPFPHDNAFAVGFVTGETPPLLKTEKSQTDLVIFVPTSPHPMSGFVLLVPKHIVKKVDVSVEDAFKFLISCGALHPGEQPPSDPESKK